MTRILIFQLSCFIALLLTSFSHSQEVESKQASKAIPPKQPPLKPATIADTKNDGKPIYNTESKTEGLLTPQQSLEALKLPEGFSATLFAAEPDIQQPPAPSGKKWFVLKSGSFGTEREDFRLEFPFEECFQAVGEELNDMQRNDAHRLISKKMEALHRTLKNLEERLSDSRQELTLLRQECGIFPPDNQTETMRHVRLLEEKRMELSIQIKAAQNLQKSAAGESSTPLSNQAMAELKNMTHLLAATEQELESANQQAKDELGALGQVEHLNTRIDALTAQRLAVEKEMNQVRSVPVVPQIKLVPLQRE